jgi:hypothetical protein
MPIPQEDSQEDFANLPLHGAMLGDYLLTIPNIC